MSKQRPLDQAKPYLEQGNALLTEKKYDDSINAFQQAINLHHNYREAYRGLISALKSAGRNEEAKNIAARETELKPGGLLFYFYIGKDFLAAGNKNEALANFKRANFLIKKSKIGDSNPITGFINSSISPKERELLEKLLSFDEVLPKLEEELKTLHNNPNVKDIEEDVSQFKQNYNDMIDKLLTQLAKDSNAPSDADAELDLSHQQEELLVKLQIIKHNLDDIVSTTGSNASAVVTAATVSPINISVSHGTPLPVQSLPSDVAASKAVVSAQPLIELQSKINTLQTQFFQLSAPKPSDEPLLHIQIHSDKDDTDAIPVHPLIIKASDSASSSDASRSSQLTKLSAQIQEVIAATQQQLSQIAKGQEDNAAHLNLEDITLKDGGASDRAQVKQISALLAAKSPDLYLYYQIFYWCLLNFFDVNRVLSSGLIKGNSASEVAPTDVLVVGGAQKIAQYVEGMASQVPFIGGVITILDDVVNYTYQQVKDARFKTKEDAITSCI